MFRQRTRRFVVGSADPYQHRRHRRHTIHSKLTFVPNEENDTEGDVTIASEIAVLDVLPSNDSLVAPYEISLYGTSEIKGTYRMVDDDEIIISLDNSTLNVNISSKDIRFNESQFTQRLIPDEIKTKHRK